MVSYRRLVVIYLFSSVFSSNINSWSPHLVADSEDRGILDLSLPVGNITAAAATPSVPYPEASEVFIGQDWYALSQNLPSGTPFTWGINLRSLNKTESVAQAAHLADTFQGSRASELADHPLKLLELGNEPDLYDKTAVPAIVNYTSWSPLNYSMTWNDYLHAISGVMKFGSESGTYIQTAAFAGGETWRQFSSISALEAGLLDDPTIAGFTTTYADHFYNSVFSGTSAPSGQLMPKQYVRENATLRLNDLRAVKASGLDFVWVS